MRHQIPLDELRTEIGPRADAMAEAIARCVHCGFCLATCPTYLALGEEMDSPRGRIFLMKEVLEGSLDLDESLQYIDPCLGCIACETSCPSGVEYGQLLHPFRAQAERKRKSSWWRRTRRALVLDSLSSPARFRTLLRLGAMARPAKGLLPPFLRAGLDLIPPKLEPRFEPPARTEAQGKRRARVALLAGCAQQVLTPDVHRATLDLLSRNGVEVIVPRPQGCCGALALHSGDETRARRLAARNLLAFDDDSFDAVITNAAGCGSGLREMAHLFSGSDDEETARRLAAKVRDVSELLDELGLVEPPPPLEKPIRVAYQDACHLSHAQGVKEAPRRLLRAIDGLELVEPAEAEVCCGSAGTYNLEQPAIAAELGSRKTRALLETGAELVASGNVGCMTQIQHHLSELREPLPVRHTMQVLRDAYHRQLG